MITDRKLPAQNGGGVDFAPDVVSAQDYYPFGMLMPGRQYANASFANNGYRFGFNGQEKDDEIYGTGSSTTAPFWQYDPRLGRRWNRDPVTYPWQSTYSTNNNNPVVYSDPLGLFGKRSGARKYKKENGLKGYKVRKNRAGAGYTLDHKSGDHSYARGPDGNVHRQVNINAKFDPSTVSPSNGPTSLEMAIAMEASAAKNEGTIKNTVETSVDMLKDTEVDPDLPLMQKPRAWLISKEKELVYGIGDMIYIGVQSAFMTPPDEYEHWGGGSVSYTDRVNQSASFISLPTMFLNPGAGANSMADSKLLVGFGDDFAVKWAQENLISQKGIYDVVIHGAPDGLGFIMKVGGQPFYLHPEQLYNMMLANGYKAGTTIRLVACNSGKLPNGAAYQIHKLSGAKVYAPNNLTWVEGPLDAFPAGTVRITGDLRGTGLMNIFE